MAVFEFPDPVNEVSARLVALGALLLAALVLLTQQWWLTLPLAYGFIARVASGPKFSPLALFVTRTLVPRLPFETKFVPGPPKRFAQGIGASVTSSAAVLALVFHQHSAASVLLALIVVAATLESVFALCIGCKIFGALVRLGVIPESTCIECSNLGERLAS